MMEEVINSPLGQRGHVRSQAGGDGTSFSCPAEVSRIRPIYGGVVLRDVFVDLVWKPDVIWCLSDVYVTSNHVKPCLAQTVQQCLVESCVSYRTTHAKALVKARHQGKRKFEKECGQHKPQRWWNVQPSILMHIIDSKNMGPTVTISQDIVAPCCPWSLNPISVSGLFLAWRVLWLRPWLQLKWGRKLGCYGSGFQFVWPQTAGSCRICTKFAKSRLH